MNGLLTSRNIPFIVLIIPDVIQVDDEIFNWVMKELSLSIDEYDRELPKNKLTDFLQAQSIPYLDLLPHFKSHSENLYIQYDNHFNILGHRLVADLLYEYLSNFLK